MSKIDFIRGDTVNLELDLGTNIAGATVFFTAKSVVTDSDNNAVLSKEVTDHTDEANGLTTISFTAAETDAVDPGDYVYDIQVKYADGSVESWPTQRMKVRADVTRRTE